MAQRIRQLNVLSNRESIGLTGIAPEQGSELWSFIYGSGNGEEVALNMGRERATYAWKGIFPAFEQHLPEMDIGLFPAAVWKSVYQDHAGMLWLAGRRRLGRLRFTRPDEPLPDVASTTLTREQILKTTHGDELLADILSKLTDIAGVSGVQPKALIRLADVDEPLRALSETHLLKGNRAEYAYATAVESCCLELARRCGLEVPDASLSGDGRLLAIERFDLNKDKSVRGFDEACALMGLWARDKYEKSNEALYKALSAHIPYANLSDFTDSFIRLQAFNLLIENGDAHLKNFGLLYDSPDNAKLAPAYDLLTTTCFDGMERDAPALPLGGRKRWDAWPELVRFANGCGMTTRRVVEILNQLEIKVRQNLSLPLLCAEQYPAAQGVLNKVHEAWQRGVDRLADYLSDARSKRKSGQRDSLT